MPDRGAGCGEKPLRMVDALHGVKPGLGNGVKLRGQAVDLLDVKDGVAFQERDIPLRSSPVSSSVCVRVTVEA